MISIEKPSYTDSDGLYGTEYSADRNRMWSLRPFCIAEGLKTILELGTSSGFGSTYAFLESGCNVITVDINESYWNHNSYGDTPNKYPDEWYNRVFRFICNDLELPLAKNQRFDMVFIDTTHDYEQTKLEIELAKKHASRFIGFDDLSHSGVNQAIKEAGLQIEIVGTDIGVYRIKIDPEGTI